MNASVFLSVLNTHLRISLYRSSSILTISFDRRYHGIFFYLLVLEANAVGVGWVFG